MNTETRDAEVLDDIPFEIDLAELRRRLHLDESDAGAETLRRLVAEAQAIGRPKAM